MTGYIYVGFQNKRTKHGTFKILLTNLNKCVIL